MYKSVRNVAFPSQVVSDLEKMTGEYGLEVGRAIASEWMSDSRDGNRFNDNHRNFHNLRLYARGEQSIQKYKDELSINGDLSYLNLDWTPVPIVSKFVDIIVNGIAERMYKVKAFSQDPFGINKRTEYMESMLADMKSKSLSDTVMETLGIDLNENEPEEIPGSEEELDLHMQLTYKQAAEIAEEQAISVLLEGSDYELIRKRFYYDLAVLGIGAVKTTFDWSEGAKVQYVDPANLVYSYTESPYFEDLYYIGEVKEIPVNELVKQFPDLTHENLEEIVQNTGATYNVRNSNDDNKIQVLYFNYKTYMNEVYKMKETKSGGDKAIEKDDSFNPPEDKEGGYSKMKRCIEVLFEGAMILGCDKLLKWEIAENMMRPKSDFTKVKMNYSVVAPRIYNGKIESLVGRITGFADMIQLTHLKLQQIMSRMVPDGVYLDADGLAEIDLGNGTNYNPQEALNMFFQTGSVIGRSFTSEGDQNPGKIPIQEISGGQGAGNKISSLINTYNYYLQMIRDVTGLNEASDGSMPEKYSLVGVQKLAAANSNTATRHILQAGINLTKDVCEALSLRVSDIIEYSPTKEAFIHAIGSHNVAVLEEMKELHLYDFGIFIELTPDEEQQAMLENNIQAALAQQSIDLEDAIDLRDIRNVKLANQLLKIRRKRKLDRDQKMQQENMQAQAQANIAQQQSSAQLEMQKKQSEAQTELNLEQVKSRLQSDRMQMEAALKKELMDHEFEINLRLKKMESDALKDVESSKDDRKDKRTKIEATQESELIDQKENKKPPKNFESTSDDTIGGLDLSGFAMGS
tara:strand:+ start:701 stop:3106 length:2406 start_codon:yes stop_codon:yes gene_type:complete